MPRLPKLLFCAALLAATTDAQIQSGAADKAVVKRFNGKLSPELKPDFVHIYQRVFEAKPVKVGLTMTLRRGVRVTTGELIDQRSPTGKTEVLLVEPGGTSEPYIAIDLDSNGAIGSGEQFPLARVVGTENFRAVINLPTKNSFYKTFPISITYPRGFKHPRLKPTDRLILQTIIALAHGTVDLDGRKTLFQYPFEPQSPAISTTDGLYGIDVDGDGEIRNEQFSPETSYATKSEIVFRLGDMFVSTERIDLAKNEIVVRTRGREEYLRNEIEVGKAMPDFSFVDFDDKKRALYDFKGNYVLIDFWGVWCGDCVRETPYLIEAAKRFRSRGLEILALNTDENIETAKAYLKENNLTWTQARFDSIRTLAEVTYRIQEYPSTILIGPDSKVLVLKQKELRGDELLKTLDRILPK